MKNKKLLVLPLIMVMALVVAVIPNVKAAAPTVSYRGHVQSFGWEEEWKTNGELSGTTGLAKRVEALQVKIEGLEDVSVFYKSHVQSFGWEESWKSNGEESGTTGLAKRVEAIAIAAPGLKKYGYVLKYRVHGQTYGWQDWKTASDSTEIDITDPDNFAGTTGLAKRLEAIEIKIVKADDYSDVLADAKENARTELEDAVVALEEAGTYTGEDTKYQTGEDEEHNPVYADVHGNAFQLMKAVSDGGDAIEAAKTVEEVEEALASAKEAINAVKNDEQAAADLASAKTAAKDEIANYVNEDNYTQNAVALAGVITAANDAIDDAKSEEEVEFLATAAEEAIDEIHPDDVQAMVDSYKTKFNNKVAAAVSAPITAGDLNDTKTEGLAAIDAAQTIDAVKAAYDEALDALLLNVKEVLTEELEKYISVDGNDNKYLYADTDYEEALDGITNANSVAEAKAIYAEVITNAMTANEYDFNAAKSKVLTNIKDYAKEALKTKNIDAVARTQINDAVETAEEDIQGVVLAGNTPANFRAGVEAVNGIYNTAKNTIDDAVEDTIKANDVASIDALVASLKAVGTYTNDVVDAVKTKDNFDAAVEAAKAAITGADGVEAVNAAMEAGVEAIEAIKNDKDQAKANLDAQVTALNINVDYTINKGAVENALAEGKEAVDAAELPADVKEAYDEAKAAIAAIEADAAVTDLVAAKDGAKATLNNYKNEEDYTANIADLRNAIRNGEIAIDAAENKAAITSALNAAKTLIDAIESDEDIAATAEAKAAEEAAKAELAAAKVDRIAEFNAAVDAKKAVDTYTESDTYDEDGNRIAKGNATLLEEAIANAIKAINDAANIGAIPTVVDLMTTYVTPVSTDAQILAAKKADAIAELEGANVKTKLNAANMTEARAEIAATIATDNKPVKNIVANSINSYVADENFAEIIDQAIEDINAATTVADIENVRDEAIASVVAELRTFTKGILTDIYNSGASHVSGCMLTFTQYNKANKAIDAATTVTTVITAYNNAVATATEVHDFYTGGV